MIWKKTMSLADCNKFCQQTAISHLGIEFTQQGDDYLEATVPVDHRTVQPFGLLHGGISATLAETLGSLGAALCCDENQIPVGTELNISHLKAVRQGKARGRAKPVHLGGSSQVWQIDIYNEKDELCAVSRLSVRVLDKK
ncbi:hotdog fold thioesterase [Otariodibacter oris]|uniref:Uncharacterized protein (TIGR00369 family) n=1 Tax=Otariodibacter oris TaxID=1032623 RepID=A0A420XGC5_9PAST|nr:hotdog fold thioesterase [Otariodibacter oris]QGM80046.1 thioesterase [Otariodibacter oris]RKR71870.1 uncharacterized protein (TIGR00369 family) [Otariodibacter oris]